MTQAAMVPYKRTPPPLAMRLFFATMLFVMGPVFWVLQRFKLDGKLFAAMRARQRKELLTKNPFKGYQPTEHDVFVVTYVKSGTNWMMQLAHQLLFHGKGDYEHIHCVVAWPDTDLMGPMRGYAIPLRDPRVWQASPEGEARDQDALPVGGRAVLPGGQVHHRHPRPEGRLRLELSLLREEGAAQFHRSLRRGRGSSTSCRISSSWADPGGAPPRPTGRSATSRTS